MDRGQRDEQPMNSATQRSSADATGGFLDFVAKAAPPAFTIPALAMKAFIPSLTGVFVLGTVLAVGMYFHAPNIELKKWYERISLVLTCFAWLLIIDETGANEILNRFILGNSVDDHTYVVRFVAGAFVVLNMVVFGFHFESQTRTPRGQGPAGQAAAARAKPAAGSKSQGPTTNKAAKPRHATA